MVNRPNSITGCPNWSGMSVHCSCMCVLGRECGSSGKQLSEWLLKAGGIRSDGAPLTG